MRVTHRLTIVGSCPVDGARDEYEAVVVVGRALPVEDILAAAAAATARPAFQEDVTAELAGALRADVTTRGVHSGVRTTVECPAPAEAVG